MPAPTLNFNGIPFPGVACNCAPPDTNGEICARGGNLMSEYWRRP